MSICADSRNEGEGAEGLIVYGPDRGAGKKAQGSVGEVVAKLQVQDNTLERRC